MKMTYYYSKIHSFKDLDGVIEAAVIIPAGLTVSTIRILDRDHQPFALNGSAKIANKSVRPTIEAALFISSWAICVCVPFV